jgi:carbamoyl-phosphate synthase small subunit
MTRARLLLEDGTLYEGESFGSTATGIGEVVFNTSLTGYQEIATDPSYRFQIVVMTYPHIGNYGIEEPVGQSSNPQVSGFVVREACTEPSYDRSTMTIGNYFDAAGVPGIEGIDTRALTRRIRNQGAMRGIISSDPAQSDEQLLASVRSAPSMAGLDLVDRVSTERSYGVDSPIGPRKRVAVYDYGVKRDILRRLAVVLSNGPGDPEPVTYAQENIRKLIGRIPLFGICLGHQLLGLALGGQTYKLKFGHRGGNHPVKDLRSGRVEITAQNHGFSVDPDSLSASDVELTHINLNDNTLEGFRHRREPVMAVQYHPESAPGPHDSIHLFHDFLKLVDEWQGKK